MMTWSIRVRVIVGATALALLWAGSLNAQPALASAQPPNSWAPAAAMPGYPDTLGAEDHGLWMTDGKLLTVSNIVGRYTVVEYDPASDSWSTEATLPSEFWAWPIE